MTPRLLVVDDDVQIGQLITRVAASVGYETVATHGLESFRRAFRAGAANVIVLDLSMRGGDGIDVLRFLAEESCKTPIVIMSGVEQRILESAARLGHSLGLTMAGTLPKPASAANIRAMLGHAQQLAQGAPGTADLATDLRFAIERGELGLVYQPKVALPHRGLAGVEALMRWTHPTHGPIAPAAFIPLAEQHGLIDQLTNWGLREALRHCAAWQRQGLAVDLAYNLSLTTLKDVGLPDELETMCAAEGIPPERLTLELTESATQEPVRLMDILTRVRLKGMNVAIDDFGTGYSSLMQLRRLPFTELKIDQAFVKELATAPDCAVIVKALIDMSRGLGLRVTAEGVESSDILDQLCALGCDMAQGYFISRPLPPDALPAWVRAGLEERNAPAAQRAPCEGANLSSVNSPTAPSAPSH